MNLGGLENSKFKDVVGTVLQEFGHALGAKHEHQHPRDGCDDEWRWDDDAGYVTTTDKDGYLINDLYNRRPGIYTIMSGAPNYWSHSKVDYNMRSLRNQNAYDFGDFDKYSIMKYYFPPDYFRKWKDSPCYSGEPATELSQEDTIRIAEIYPYDAANMARAQEMRGKMMSSLKGLKKSLPSNRVLDSAIRALSE